MNRFFLIGRYISICGNLIAVGQLLFMRWQRCGGAADKSQYGGKVYASHWDKNRQIARMGGGLSGLDSRNNAIVNTKIMEVTVQIEQLKQYLCKHIELLTDEAKVKSLFVDCVNPIIKKTMAAKKNTNPLRH